MKVPTFAAINGSVALAAGICYDAGLEGTPFALAVIASLMLCAAPFFCSDSV